MKEKKKKKKKKEKSEANESMMETTADETILDQTTEDGVWWMFYLSGILHLSSFPYKLHNVAHPETMYENDKQGLGNLCV